MTYDNQTVVTYRELIDTAVFQLNWFFCLQMLQAAALSFTFSLTLDNGEEEYNGVKLNNYGLHEMIDSAAYFTLRLPQKGLYRFIIYGKDTDQEVGVHLGIY
jgi:hypothetical protein